MIKFLWGCETPDSLLLKNLERKTSKDILQAWKQLRGCYPHKERIFIIMDNLSSHWKSSLVEYAKANRITLVPTPTYASWLNAIEAHFTPLKKFCITNSDDQSHLERRKRIYRYLSIRNREHGSNSCCLSFFRKY